MRYWPRQISLLRSPWRTAAQATEEWQTTAAPYHAPRARHGGRRHRDRTKPLLSREAKRRWLVASVVAAVAGATYYALAPGVASTQIGIPLTLPLLFIALVWLH